MALKEPPEWWRSWFGPSYLALYDEYGAARAPIEVDQLEGLLRLRPPARVLDLGCGHGRHAIELARRGYEVTGLDLSPYLLRVAGERSRKAGVRVRWIEADMRQPPTEQFDLVLNLFTTLGYFADDRDNQAVLDAAAARLPGGGRLLLEILNKDNLLRTFEAHNWYTIGSATVIEERRLEQADRRLLVHRSLIRDEKEESDFHSIRLYDAVEIEAALRAAGFDGVELYGDWNGEPLTELSSRLLAVAQHR